MSGISAIGYPMMGYGNYGLGNYGLDAGGAYGSYDGYMMGMNSPYGYGYGMSGMMGMYNPTFMAQMQANMEKLQLQHAGDMHSMTLNNEVRANRESNRAMVSKLLTDASVQQGVQNLYDKVIEGDQDGICEEFDTLKKQIYNTYKDELMACGNEENPATAATKIIEQLYTEIVKGRGGETTGSLKEDIKHFGDGAFANGFLKGLKHGHHDKYVDETINYCFGDRIDERKSKEHSQTVGKWVGKGAHIGAATIAGAAIGTIGYSAGSVLVKGAGKALGANWNPLKVKGAGKVGVIAGLLALGLDTFWQIKSHE